MQRLLSVHGFIHLGQQAQCLQPRIDAGRLSALRLLAMNKRSLHALSVNRAHDAGSAPSEAG